MEVDKGSPLQEDGRSLKTRHGPLPGLLGGGGGARPVLGAFLAPSLFVSVIMVIMEWQSVSQNL